MRSKRRRDNGSAFVMALVLSVALTILVVAFSERIGMYIQNETTKLESRHARQAAMAGIARAQASLELMLESTSLDTEEWWTMGSTGDESFVVGRGSFRLQILDAGRLIDINRVEEEQLRNLFLTDEQVDSLLDWREEDLQPRAQGAKDTYYNNLAEPYNTKLRDFETLDELFLVRGFTPSTLFEINENVSGTGSFLVNDQERLPLSELLTVDSLSENVREDGTARINVNQSNQNALIQAGISQQAAEAIIQQRNTVGTFETLGDVFDTPGLSNTDAEAILEALTVEAGGLPVRGKINLNTALPQVLASVPEMQPDLVDSIIARQGTFVSLGELATLPGVSVATLSSLADVFTVNSLAFHVRVIGSYGGSTVALEALVVMNEGRATVRKVRNGPQSDVLVRWGWNDEAAYETVLTQR